MALGRLVLIISAYGSTINYLNFTTNRLNNLWIQLGLGFLNQKRFIELRISALGTAYLDFYVASLL